LFGLLATTVVGFITGLLRWYSFNENKHSRTTTIKDCYF
jgi:hypothetical protein